jgi:hypothetical protein
MEWKKTLTGLILVAIFSFGCLQYFEPKELTSDEALSIAQQSECSNYLLAPDKSYYNNKTKTWKIMIEKTGPAACIYWCEIYQNHTAKFKGMCSGV